MHLQTLQRKMLIFLSLGIIAWGSMGISSRVEEAAVPPLLSGSLEDRLGRLKRLWDQGLIAEEAYSAKKEELLDRW